MTLKSMTSRLAVMAGAGLILAATPVAIQHGPDGFRLAPSHAFAKDGRDDDGGGNSGSGRGGDRSDDDGDDDHGGGDDRGGDRSDDDDHGGRDDRGGNDDRGGGHGSDDGPGDDHGSNSGRDGGGDDRGRGGSRDDRGGNSGRGGSRSDDGSGGVEVVRADGTKEEVRGGRYERKDASGRTVEQRPATSADLARLSSAAASGRRTISVGYVKKVEAIGGNLEIRYSTGWREELENGRYELKDPDNNTVVERPARQADIDRLTALANR